MVQYWYIRAVIVSLVLLFFGLAGFFSSNHFTAWSLILLVTTVVGFTHYLVGAYYQLRSFTSLEKPRKAYLWFLGLTTIATVTALGFIVAGHIVSFALITIGYFMLHGFYNEITLYEKGTGQTANRFTIAAVAIGLFALLMIAVAHPSSFFSPQLEYVLQNDYLAQVYLSSALFPQVCFWFGVVGMVAAVALQLIATFRSSKYLSHSLFLVGLLLVGIGAGLAYPPSYIHVFSGLLLYHFLVWFWFYFQAFSRRSKSSLYHYLTLHLLVLFPFLALLSEGMTFTVVDVFVLNSYLFLTLTTIHITVSFMSEPWFKRRFLT